MSNLVFISHRGNIHGPQPNDENKIEYIYDALDNGFYVEIDVWCKNNEILLGHDEGVYPAQMSLLENANVLCHAKNFLAIEMMKDNKKIHWFYHDKDSCTLTSKQWIWTYPDNIISGSILNQPEFNNKWNKEECVAKFIQYTKKYDFIGVCSDYVGLLKGSI